MGQKLAFMIQNELGFTKGQLISKGLYKNSFAPKNERKYFCISAPASKKRSNKKK